MSLMAIWPIVDDMGHKKLLDIFRSSRAMILTLILWNNSRYKAILFKWRSRRRYWRLGLHEDLFRGLFMFISPGPGAGLQAQSSIFGPGANCLDMIEWIVRGALLKMNLFRLNLKFLKMVQTSLTLPHALIITELLIRISNRINKTTQKFLISCVY